MMTMPAELARAWEKMWHLRAYFPRPWWRHKGATCWFERVDGWVITGDDPSDVENPSVLIRSPGGNGRDESVGGLSFEEAMSYVDTNHPLPAPDPMPGQVWVSAGGTQCMIAAVWRYGDSWWVQWASNPDAPVRWEPPTSVLVAGPTPWGRDVPWAPVVAK
jgi:alkanesulfonate monooxygenase SsuD/methylene tetrahydromethanopterin reductase-like flavin-dependent oxidoreductase (luciferase family)